MGRFQSCKGVVERALRRAFYDGVLELYEGCVSDRVVCVALEGSLALTINRSETLVIKLNEVAQRADETVEESHDVAPHEVQAKHEAYAGTVPTKPKKRRAENQSVFPERVAVKKEIKQEKPDYEFDRPVSPPHTDSLPSPPHATVADQPQSHGEEREDMAAASRYCAELELSHPHHASPAWNDEADTRRETNPCDSTHSAEAQQSQTSVSGQRGTESERHSCIRKGPAHTVTTIKEEPEAIVIDDEEDEQDSGCDTSPYWTSARLSWQHAARQQLEDEVLPLSLWTSQCDCPVCGEIFHASAHLASHLHKHRHTFRATCQVCRTDTLTLDALHLHLRAAHAPRLFPLPSTVTPDSLALLPAHPYRQGSAIASLVSMAACPLVVGPAVDQAAALLASTHVVGGRVSQVVEQILAYQSQIARCSVCKLLFASKHDLAAHMLSAHRGHKMMAAHADQECGDEAGPSGARRQGGGAVLDDNGREDEVDLTSVEIKSTSPAFLSNDSAYTCFDCSMGFPSHATFTQHCILHHGTPSVASQGSCSVCRKSFETWKALRSHYYSTHRITSFCDKCKLGFTCHEEMKVHHEVTHASDPHNMTFVCDICSKGFYSQSQCSAHKRSHVSEKSFACQVCGSAFFKRGDLSKHFRTVHAPNRVFACRFCGKRGTRMDNMRSHVKSHGKHMTRDEILAMIEEVKT